jgi:hypothetical protein
MRFLANETVSRHVVGRLRTGGFDVTFTEIGSGTSDKDVLKVADIENCILITENRDFGELASVNTWAFEVWFCWNWIASRTGLISRPRVVSGAATTPPGRDRRELGGGISSHTAIVKSPARRCYPKTIPASRE